MKKRSIPKNNIKEKTAPSFVMLNNFRDRTTRKSIVTETFIEKLGDELVDWALKEARPTSIEKFLSSFGLYISDLTTIRKKFPYFNDAYNFTKMVIGSNIEEKGLYREMDSGSAERKLPQYLERCRKEQKRVLKLQAKYKSQEDKNHNPTTLNISMPKFVLEEEKKSAGRNPNKTKQIRSKAVPASDN